MSKQWKITFAYNTPGGSPQNEGNAIPVWNDDEEPELAKLSKAATAAARESLKLIDARKAEACRKQMLKELLSAK